MSCIIGKFNDSIELIQNLVGVALFFFDQQLA